MFTDIFGEKRYKINLHTHTTLSDGRKTPEEVARKYRESGYDAIALTDHWVAGTGRDIDGLPILAGCEYDFSDKENINPIYHIVSLMCDKDPMVNRNDDTQSCIDKIKAVNGIAVLAHPAWSVNDPYLVSKLNGVDFTEIYNTVSGLNNSSRPYSGAFVDVLATNYKKYPKLLAVDDVHFFKGDEAYCSIMVKSKSLTSNDIKDAMRNGDFYATEGPEIHLHVENDKAIVDCSPANIVNFYNNAPCYAGYHTIGEGITHVEVPIGAAHRYIRAEVTDKNGRRAYSNIIVLK